MHKTKKLSEWKKDLEKQDVKVHIPKFKFKTKYLMADTLTEMGMSTAFGGAADFSGMTMAGNFWIDSVIHQAYIKVDEKGTEAAAATAVVGVGSAPPMHKTPIFRANHPFIFLIQDKSTGNVLFMGRVVNPTK